MSGVGGISGSSAANTLTVLKSRLIAGVTNMGNGLSTFTVSFTDVGTNLYSVDLTVQNLVDANPRHLIGTVKTKTSSGFSFQTAQTTNSANYKANWIIYLDASSDIIPAGMTEEGGGGMGIPLAKG